MAQTVKKWYDGLGNNRQETLNRLTKVDMTIQSKVWGG